MDEASLFDTIRRLLALGSSRCNEHEAQAAMAKAYELCARYNVDIAAARSASPIDDGWEEASGWTGDATIPFHVKMAAQIVEIFFFVRLVRITHFQKRHRKKELTLFGRKENVAIGQYVLTYLIRTFWQLWKARRRPAKHRRPYFLGVAQGLAKRLHEQRKAAAYAAPADAHALTIVQSDLDREFQAREPDLKPPQILDLPEIRAEEAMALLQGRADGAKIELRPAVNASQRRLLPAPA